MSDSSSEVWRDEQRLPLRDLERAMAVSAADGEVDDVTGNDAGAETAFGHGPEAADGGESTSAARRDLTDDQRQYRPSTTGRTGPH